METPEAKFAHTLDKIQPVLLTDRAKGKSWLEHGRAQRSDPEAGMKGLMKVLKFCGIMYGISLKRIRRVVS